MMGERSHSGIEDGNRGRTARRIAAAAGCVAALVTIAGCDTLNGPMRTVGSNPVAATPAATHKSAAPPSITFTTEAPAFPGIGNMSEDTTSVNNYSKGGQVDVVCEATGREYKHGGQTSDKWLMLDTTNNPYVSVLDGTLTGQPSTCSGMVP